MGLLLGIRDKKLSIISDDHVINIEFNSKIILDRVRQGIKHNLVAKALGVHKKTQTILDLTAGLGQDSFVAAAFGANVHMVERNNMMYQVLQDGLERAKYCGNKTVEDIASRMFLYQKDSIDTVEDTVEKCKPDCIYIDPMYPERKKSALGKKKFRVIHTLVGEDSDATLLLKKALDTDIKVVVKRPKLAPPLLEGIQPSMQMTGKSTRFDIYLP